MWRRFLALPAIARLVLGGVTVVIVIAVVALLGRTGTSTNVASRSTTTLSTVRLALTTTSSTTPPLPAGEDKQVKAGIDGDSFQLTDGTKIRFIGIDAPDVETSACYSAEATAHLKDVLPANTMVRLVYDANKTDQYGRTLAYVYRLPDALFVNLAFARDGYAIQQSLPPNTAHDTDLGAAVADAKAAGRGSGRHAPRPLPPPVRCARPRPPPAPPRRWPGRRPPPPLARPAPRRRSR